VKCFIESAPVPPLFTRPSEEYSNEGMAGIYKTTFEKLKFKLKTGILQLHRAVLKGKYSWQDKPFFLKLTVRSS
jgi:hypothetical protein